MTEPRLWPIRPDPLEDELLTSWVTRLAHGHGLQPARFLEVIWPSGCAFQALDWTADPDLIALLSAKTAVPRPAVEAMTLRLEHGQTLDLIHHAWHGPALQYCPACLAEPIPYFRRRWWLAFVRVCSRHRLALLDYCTRCGAAVRLEDLPPESRRVSMCRTCGDDLGNGQRQPLAASVGIERLVSVQDRLASAVILSTFLFH